MNKKLFSLLCVIFLQSLSAQNLLTNPGFEQNMLGWDELWTRTPNSGSADIVSSPVHAGSHALHIQHWDEQDWSFRHTDPFEVTPGDIYQFSAWVDAVAIDDWVELSVILYDDSGTVMDWSFSPNYISLTDGFELFSSQFIIPPNVASLTVRIVGGGDTDIYVDDMFFQRQGTVGPNENYVLENAGLRFELEVPSLAMNVQLKNGKSWSFQPTNTANFSNVTHQSNALVLTGIILAQNFEFDLTISLSDHTLSFELSGDSKAPLDNALLFPGYTVSQHNEYLVIPRATGMLLPVSEEYPFWEFGLYDWKATMAFVGVTDLESGYMLYTKDPWDSRFRFIKPVNSSLSTFQFIHQPSKDAFGYDRHFYMSFFEDGGYVEMAKTYRAFAEKQGYVKTFNEKAADNSNIDKLLGAVDFWALQGEFRRTNFIDSLYHFGMDKAIVSLGGGWYNDHDHSEIIDHINDLGLLSSRYDIYTDVYPNEHPGMPWYRTEGYPEDVIVNSDGSLRTGWLAYLDNGTPFQGYYTCSVTHADYARKWIADDLNINPYNCRFIDVELSSSLVECYSPDHPTTRHSDGVHRIELLDVVKNEFDLVTGSEEVRDFALPVVDFGEGTMSIQPAENSGHDWFTPTNDPGDAFIDYNMNPARRIPLHGLVYHDMHVPTWYTGDGLSKVPDYWQDKELFNLLYASMPLIMPPSQNYWSRNRERFLTSMNLISAVTRHCGFAKMTNHEFLSADKRIQKAEYANGWSVIVNFSDAAYPVQNLTLPAKGFFATDRTSTVYRRILNDNIISAAELPDRLFIQPHEQSVELKGVRTSGAVLLVKYDDFIKLSLIGDQEFIDVHPAQLPWPVDELLVQGFHSHAAVPLQAQAGGYIRIPETNGERFYKLLGDFQTAVDEDKGEHAYSVDVYPNPFNAAIHINYSLAAPERVIIQIYNVLGQKVKSLMDTDKAAGRYKLVWNGENDSGMHASSGIYWITMTVGDWQQTRRILMIN